MDTDPAQDTLPSPATRSARRAALSPLGRFVHSMPGAFVILVFILGAVLAFAGIGGYYAGVSDRDRAAATAQAIELQRQYQLGVEDMEAGRYLLAVQRFQAILALEPDFPGAAAGLAEARAAASPGTATPSPSPTASPTPGATIGPQTAQALFAEAQAAYAEQDWETTLQKVSALRAVDPGYEGAMVRKMFFEGLRNRGIGYINAGKLELGLSDLEQAAKVGALDTEAQQYQQWAAIYISGVSYWGLNWPRTIETFQLLYTLAPYFRDTSTRLRDAHLAYAQYLEAGGDPCGAVKEYAAALELQADPTVEAKRAAAETACQFGTPTPDGTLTPFPTPEETQVPIVP